MSGAPAFINSMARIAGTTGLTKQQVQDFDAHVQGLFADTQAYVDEGAERNVEGAAQHLDFVQLAMHALRAGAKTLPKRLYTTNKDLLKAYEAQLKGIIDEAAAPPIDDTTFKALVESGSSDRTIADYFHTTKEHVKLKREAMKIVPLHPPVVQVNRLSFVELANSGASDEEIARAFDIKPQTVKEMREEMGLGMPRKSIGVDELLELLYERKFDAYESYGDIGVYSALLKLNMRASMADTKEALRLLRARVAREARQAEVAAAVARQRQMEQVQQQARAAREARQAREAEAAAAAALEQQQRQQCEAEAAELAARLQRQLEQRQQQRQAERIAARARQQQQQREAEAVEAAARRQRQIDEMRAAREAREAEAAAAAAAQQQQMQQQQQVERIEAAAAALQRVMQIQQEIRAEREARDARHLQGLMAAARRQLLVDQLRRQMQPDEVRFPGDLWHIGGHHKLAKYGFIITGVIDDRTRLITSLQLSDNNRDETVLRAFAKGVAEHGLPMKLRADREEENIAVREVMYDLRGEGEHSFVSGTPTHARRIARLWVDMQAWCTKSYAELFEEMEASGELDIHNERHIFALQLAFFPHLQLSLQRFLEMWNWHPMSTCRNKTPLQMWLEERTTQQHLGRFAGTPRGAATHASLQINPHMSLYAAGTNEACDDDIFTPAGKAYLRSLLAPVVDDCHQRALDDFVLLMRALEPVQE